MDCPPRILFIDAARVLGWAYGPAGCPPISGFVECSKQGSSRSATFSGGGGWFTVFAKEHPIDVLAIEAPLLGAKILSNVETWSIAVGLPAVIEFMAYRLGIFQQERLNQSSIKKHFVNNGRGDQKMAIRKKCLALGWVSQSEAVEDKGFNRTDALAGWSFTEQRYAPKLAQPVDDLFVKAEQRRREAEERAAAEAAKPSLFMEKF